MSTSGGIRTLEAVAVKEDQWWEITIPELDQSTSTSEVSEIQQYATDLAAATLDCSADEVLVNVTLDLPDSVRAEWEEVSDDVARAKELTAKAAADSKRVVDALCRDGYTLRAIAELLGISLERVEQIAHSKPDSDGDPQEGDYIF